MKKRTAREINVSSQLLLNKHINVKIGTVENKENPNTVYIIASFWIDTKNGDRNVNLKNRKLIEKHLNKITNKNFIQENISADELFTYESDNIYIINVPKNFHYNNKPSFVIIEFYLNTINIKGKKIPLNTKKDLRLFNKGVDIANAIGKVIQELEEFDFVIKKTQKTNPI